MIKCFLTLLYLSLYGYQSRREGLSRGDIVTIPWYKVPKPFLALGEYFWWAFLCLVTRPKLPETCLLVPAAMNEL